MKNEARVRRGIGEQDLPAFYVLVIINGRRACQGFAVFVASRAYVALISRCGGARSGRDDELAEEQKENEGEEKQLHGCGQRRT
jgi:hypothetical protein